MKIKLISIMVQEQQQNLLKSILLKISSIFPAEEFGRDDKARIGRIASLKEIKTKTMKKRRT